MNRQFVSERVGNLSGIAFRPGRRSHSESYVSFRKFALRKIPYFYTHVSDVPVQHGSLIVALVAYDEIRVPAFDFLFVADNVLRYRNARKMTIRTSIAISTAVVFPLNRFIVLSPCVFYEYLHFLYRHLLCVHSYIQRNRCGRVIQGFESLIGQP